MTTELNTDQKIVQLLRRMDKVKFVRNDTTNPNYEVEEMRHKMNIFRTIHAQLKGKKVVVMSTVEKDMEIPTDVIKFVKFEVEDDSFRWFELRDLIPKASKDFLKQALAVKQSEDFLKFMNTILPESNT